MRKVKGHGLSFPKPNCRLVHFEGDELGFLLSGMYGIGRNFCSATATALHFTLRCKVATWQEQGVALHAHVS